MKITREFLRSIEGQLLLLAIIFAGGAVLAVTALALRTILFEPYIRDRYTSAPTELAATLTDVAEDRATADDFEKSVERLARLKAKSETQLVVLREEVLQLAYGHWLDKPELDPQGRVAKCFFLSHASFTIERIRLTLVAGNEEQRGRAVVLLRWAVGSECQTEAMQLCHFARQRADRRHESVLVQQADLTLAVLAGEAVPSK
jgi:hypothetical protein